MMTKEQIINFYSLYAEEYDEMEKEGLLPDPTDPKQVVMMEELLARELKEDKYDTYTENELKFLYDMNIKRLNEKSSELVDYCMEYFE